MIHIFTIQSIERMNVFKQFRWFTKQHNNNINYFSHYCGTKRATALVRFANNYCNFLAQPLLMCCENAPGIHTEEDFAAGASAPISSATSVGTGAHCCRDVQAGLAIRESICSGGLLFIILAYAWTGTDILRTIRRTEMLVLLPMVLAMVRLSSMLRRCCCRRVASSDAELHSAQKRHWRHSFH